VQRAIKAIDKAIKPKWSPEVIDRAFKSNQKQVFFLTIQQQ